MTIELRPFRQGRFRRPQRVAIAALSAAAVGWMIGVQGAASSLLAAGAVGGAILGSVLVLRHKLAAGVIVLSVDLSATSFLYRDGPLSPAVDFRVVAPVVAVVLLHQYSRRRIVLTSASAGRILWLTSALGLFMAMSLIWTNDVRKTGLALMAAGAAISICWLLLTRCSPETVDEVLRATFVVALLASVAVAVVLPSYATLGSRFRGIWANPNSLGLVGAMTIAVWIGSERRARLWVVAGAAGLIVASGSRGGALAATAAVTLHFLRGRHAGRTIAVFLGGAVIVSAIAASVFTDQVVQPGATPTILRSGNSRSDVWRSAVDRSRSDLWTGTGYGTAEGYTSNSLLKLLQELGVIGISLGSAIVLIAARYAVRERGRPLSPLLLAALVNSMFESWLFVGGSPFFLLLAVGFMSNASHTTRAPSERALLGVAP